MIPSSRYYRESIFIHYSYVTFYTCSFPHNNIHTYIMYIFRVSISMCKCLYDSILLYSYIQYSHESLLLLSNFELLLSNFQLLLSNYYCLDIELLMSNCYCPTVTFQTLNCYCPTVTVYVQSLLSKHLNYYCPTIIVQTLNCYCPTVTTQTFELLLSNCYCLDIELLLSRH